MKLFRSVGPAEFESLRSLRRFVNPAGIEAKYFSPNRAGAQAYARLAAAALGEGPFVIVETSIAAADIDSQGVVVVDGGIETVVIRTAKLRRLAPPVVLPE